MPNVNKSSTTTINISCLGSSHLAANQPNAGAKYNNNEHVYLKEIPNTAIYNFTISGPSILDIGKLTIKTLTNSAVKSIQTLIEEKKITNDLDVNILGHSRGGIIANNLQKELSKWTAKQKINAKFSISLADAYAGPANRLLAKNKNISSPTDIAVITLKEKRFRSPAISNNNCTIFTILSHDKTKYISAIASHAPQKLYKVYMYNGKDPNELIKFYNDVYTKYMENPTDELKNQYKKFWNEHFDKIFSSNCNQIINNFGNNISSVARANYFFTKLSNIPGCKTIVKTNLINNHKSLILASKTLRDKLAIKLSDIYKSSPTIKVGTHKIKNLL